jgi:hypothetical protein
MTVFTGFIAGRACSRRWFPFVGLSIDVESGGFVKGFYSGSPISASPARHRGNGRRSDAVPDGQARPGLASASSPPCPAVVCAGRIAVYDGPGAAPRVEDVKSGDVLDFIELFSTHIYSLAREAGGSIPYTVVREIVENLVHADFRESVASILDEGRTIRFSDQGPGIRDKERALMPGFTTASGDAKRFIRGVGSGLPIVQDYLSFNGGSLLLEDNLGSGTVVTIRSGDGPRIAASPQAAPVAGVRPLPSPVAETVGLWSRPTAAGSAPSSTTGTPTLTLRQKQVLALVAESGGAGPSVVARELLVGVSTAYRDLASLEERGFVASDDAGRRTVTHEGLQALETFMAR